jgi:hypothetical protein
VVVKLLRERLPQLAERLPLRKAVLFGSYAKGNFTVASDIDLLLVYTGPPREDAYALAKKTLTIPRLEVHAYSEDEYRHLWETIRRMEEGGIVVFEQESGDNKR